MVSEEEIIVVCEMKETYDLGENAEGIFKKMDFKRFNSAVRRVKTY